MDANIASGETPPGVESDNSKNAIMCAMCGKVEDFFDAQDAGWEIQENLEYICNECIAKNKATADDKKENANRYFKHVEGNIIRLPADKIDKVYDLSPFSYLDKDGERCGFYDDDTGDGDTLVLQDYEEERCDNCDLYIDESEQAHGRCSYNYRPPEVGECINWRPAQVKVSDISEEIEIYKYWDGHNWKKLYLVPGQYDELELDEIETDEYSTASMKGHFNLSYDHIEAVKFKQSKYAIILSFRNCDNDEVIFITKEEYDKIMKCECTGNVFDVLENYDL